MYLCNSYIIPFGTPPRFTEYFASLPFYVHFWEVLSLNKGRGGNYYKIPPIPLS